MFISFEGIDGCGKTTQIKNLEFFLVKKNYEVVTTREPGGTEFAEQLREILLYSSHSINPVSELFLFEAARAHLIQTVIAPALQQNKIVIADRFFDSTTAYQGYGRGLDINNINLLNNIASQNIQPDVTFFLNIPLEISFQRRKQNIQDRIESADVDFFNRIISGYIAIAEKFPERIYTINSAASKADTFAQIEEIISKKI